MASFVRLGGEQARQNWRTALHIVCLLAPSLSGFP